MTGPRLRAAPSERDLAAFADGTLPAPRRRQVEEAVSASPELRAEVAVQRQVLRALDSAAAQRAPNSLRARVSLLAPPPRRRFRGPRTVAGMAAATVAACAALLVLLVAGAGGVPPTVAQASVLMERSPQAGVAEPAAEHPTLPGVWGAGLTFPYWEGPFGYRAMGMRHDELGGRRITTVFYAHGASRVAYEVVSGPPLRMGASVWSIRRQGLTLWSMPTRNGVVVAWLRRGHTCILVGARTGLLALLRMAAWREGGRVPY